MQFPSAGFITEKNWKQRRKYISEFLISATPMNWIDTSNSDGLTLLLNRLVGEVSDASTGSQPLYCRAETYIKRIGKERMLDEELISVISPTRRKNLIIYYLKDYKGAFYVYFPLITVSTAIDGFQGQEQINVLLSVLYIANKRGWSD